MSEEELLVRVRLKPFCNIGGYGKAGDVVMMSVADAERYRDEGLIVVLEKDEPVKVVRSSARQPRSKK